MKILEHTIPEEDIFKVIFTLEMVKNKFVEKKSTVLKDGWKLSVSRLIGDEILKEELKTVLAIRMANYAKGIKDTALVYYPEIEEWIRQGQEYIKYDNLTVKSGNLYLIKKFGDFFISDGINTWEIFESERRKVAYAMKYRWYYKSGDFYITKDMATFKKIPIKEPPKFYLLMEL